MRDVPRGPPSPTRRVISGLWNPRPGSGRGGGAGQEAGEPRSGRAFRPAPSGGVPWALGQAGELSVMALPSRLCPLLRLRRGAAQSVCQLARAWGSRGHCGARAFLGSEVTRRPGPALSLGGASAVSHLQVCRSRTPAVRAASRLDVRAASASQASSGTAGLGAEVFVLPALPVRK